MFDWGRSVEKSLDAADTSVCATVWRARRPGGMRLRDKLCLRRRRIEQAVTTRGGNCRPVGKPGDRPGCPRGAKAAPWDTRVSPQVCDIAPREMLRAEVTGQRRERTRETKAIERRSEERRVGKECRSRWSP